MKAHPLLLSRSALHGPARASPNGSAAAATSSKIRRRTTERMTDPQGGASLTLPFSRRSGLRWINGLGGRARGWRQPGGVVRGLRSGARIAPEPPREGRACPILVPEPSRPDHFRATFGRAGGGLPGSTASQVGTGFAAHAHLPAEASVPFQRAPMPGNPASGSLRVLPAIMAAPSHAPCPARVVIAAPKPLIPIDRLDLREGGEVLA